MTATGPVTANERILRVRATEREAMKEKKAERTYTEVTFAVLEGVNDPIRVPESAQKGKRISWVALKLYLTDEQDAFLTADAKKRGISVSRLIRADIFEPPNKPVPEVKAKSLRPRNTVPEEVRDALTAIRARPEWDYTKLMPEGFAFVEIAGVLLQREALSKQ